MRKVILNLKQKPEHIRRQVLYGVVLVCGVVLVLVWVSSLKGRFAKKADESAGLTNDLAPFYMLKDNFGKAVREVSSEVKKIGE